ncbi:hypothetical protein AAFP30_20045 [Gordonia sp. CPCC 205515]|uniref:hypothetical protein n=1 Tax=Gordonia sp. CPCC 205515 TaxID=3140791 RepID=UPI003AF37500
MEQGGVGHTAAAIARLEVVLRLARSADDAALHSLALSTHASLVRQAGRHRAAATLDGRALLLAGIGRTGQWHRAATLDAVVGLAADNLGRYRFDAARRLLDRARTLADLELADDADWFGGRRPRLRTEWVSAELAMYSGDAPGARKHSDAALHLSRGEGTPERHRVKTLLIAAAADATAGDPRSARARAGEVTARARAAGLLPLEWASYALRQGLDPDDPDLGRQLLRTRTELIRRGVPFTDL